MRRWASDAPEYHIWLFLAIFCYLIVVEKVSGLFSNRGPSQNTFSFLIQLVLVVFGVLLVACNAYLGNKVNKFVEFLLRHKQTTCAKHFDGESTAMYCIFLQLNEYETAPYFVQFSQNLTCNCLLNFVFFPKFTLAEPKIALFWCSKQF